MAGEHVTSNTAFLLVYFTFFLDNVLLTVLVPIIPDWVSGESLALWAEREAALTRVLNATAAAARARDAAPGDQALVGLVLSAKAAAQVLGAGPAAAAVCRLGAARVLHAGTALLLAAAAALAAAGGGGAAAPALAAAARAAQGAGAAAAGVAGLSLCGGAPALLGAVALGVLVGYPAGGAAPALWPPHAPFLAVAAALALDLALQYALLRKEEYNQVCAEAEAVTAWGGVRAAWREARRGAVGACAGAVLLATSVMAALEPCLPLWMARRFRPPPARWQRGAVFLPDSAAYLLAATGLGGAARALGAERLALAGQACVGAGALAVPLARSAGALAAPHALLGAGLGALDAALVPALLAAAGGAARPARAALLQAAAAAAYALGPAAGGALAAAAGFDTAMRALATANLLYAAWLYRALRAHPLSPHWGATAAPATYDSLP